DKDFVTAERAMRASSKEATAARKAAKNAGVSDASALAVERVFHGTDADFEGAPTRQAGLIGTWTTPDQMEAKSYRDYT
ncbi:hypothetical protein, partial [Vibrio alfacsensis]|uniref:hypothetical protein n=1 Tax=Vibrio alfacsensis TaxID=1074311 RepID=UPI004067D2A6